ncbi:MAG TPA: hypothetical protein VNE41_00110 [Chitinophagaceae bacterium]|nr:hypothetical protein [Chitinophagaceae bacterium]
MLKPVLLNVYETGNAIGSFLTIVFVVILLAMLLFVIIRYLGPRKP